MTWRLDTLNMALRHFVIILILKSENMFNGEKTKFGTRYYNFNNNVSSKKVEKFKEIYKRNRYRELSMNFQKWKEERNKKWAMLEVKKKKNQQVESKEEKEVKSLV